LLAETGCTPHLRIDSEKPFETDNCNYILDCHYGPIDDPVELEKRVKQLPGVVECGLFISIADVVIISFDDRVEVRARQAQ